MTEIDNKEVSVVKTQATKALSAATSLTIESPEQRIAATDMLSKMKTVAKMIKERREAITKPLNEALTSARELFKPIETNLAEAESVVKRKMIAWDTEQERIREEELAKIAKKVEDGKMREQTAIKKVEALPEAQTSSKGKVGMTSTREIPKYRVNDAEAVPREFCSPDMAKIKAALDAGREVPGAEKYYEKIISAR